MKLHQQLEGDRPQSLSRTSRSAPDRVANGHGPAKENLSLVEIARVAVDDVLELLSSQLKLARFELGADVRAAVGRVVPLALLVPVVFAGYLFGMAAVASVISGIWGWTVALAIVAAGQLLAGGVGAVVAVGRLRAGRVLERTSADVAANLKSTVQAVSSPGSRAHV